jgi:hypothetical protein
MDVDAWKIVQMTRRWRRSRWDRDPIGTDGEAQLVTGTGYCVHCGNLLDAEQRGSMCYANWRRDFVDRA